MSTFTAQLVGGPTAVLEYAGLRWLTDPSLSAPGTYEGGLVKTTGPALATEELEPIDVVLLSHEHHSDNLDPAGRAFLPRAGRVLTTTQGAERLGGNATGLEPWSSVEVARPDGGSVTVTAVPAQHGPDGTDHITGPVIGFVLSGDGLETVYVSGDNASLDVVREVARRTGAVDVAVLFAGAVSVPYRFDGAYLTLSSERAAEASKILGARTVVPVHFEGWTHFTQGADALRAAFVGNQLADRLVLLERGEKMRRTPHDGASAGA
jgi:L-ascorbate metabolism protein UlaG (beta-lactamase superfamily)